MSKVLLRRKSPSVRRDSKSTILIIDGNALCYAAKYTTGGLTYMGEPTGVVFGFIRRIMTLAKKFKTNKFIFCWDAGYTFRHDEFPDYKRKRWDRKQMDAEEKAEHELMLLQITHLQSYYLKEMGFGNAHHCYARHEGDDLIALFVQKHWQKYRLIIVSSDNDLYQLLDKADMYHLHKKKIFTTKDMYKVYGVKPNQWAIAKAIGGCNGDEVPGVVGVSDPKNPKSKALLYIKKELTKGKVFEKISSKEGQRIIQRNLKLVTLPHRMCIKTPIMRRDNFTKRKIINIFDNLHFKSLLENEKFKEWEELFINEKEE